jgi:hypothetical protein
MARRLLSRLLLFSRSRADGIRSTAAAATWPPLPAGRRTIQGPDVALMHPRTADFLVAPLQLLSPCRSALRPGSAIGIIVRTRVSSTSILVPPYLSFPPARGLISVVARSLKIKSCDFIFKGQKPGHGRCKQPGTAAFHCLRACWLVHQRSCNLRKGERQKQRQGTITKSWSCTFFSPNQLSPNSCDAENALVPFDLVLESKANSAGPFADAWLHPAKSAHSYH